VVVADGSVSRKHAHLVRRGAGWAVVDQGSANGTFLDSHRVADAQIRPGQELRFGAVSFRVDVETPTEELHPTLAGPEPTVLQGLPLNLPPPPPPAMAPPPVAAPPPLPRVAAPPAPPPRPVAPPLPARPALRAASHTPMSGGDSGAAPKKGKGPVFWTLIGCGGCLTMIVLFVAVLAGGAFFFMRGPVVVVQAQIGEIRAGEIDKAYARLSDSYRARVSRDDFADLVTGHAGLKQNAESRFWPPSGSVNVVNDKAQVSGVLISTEGERERVAYELVKEGGEWKISALRVEPNEGS
jgi:pSer/pThr/pTyr-binding forkhead associated (FHA) protein